MRITVDEEELDLLWRALPDLLSRIRRRVAAGMDGDDMAGELAATVDENACKRLWHKVYDVRLQLQEESDG